MWTWRFVGLLILGIALITAITSVTVAAISLTQQVHTAQYVDTISKNVSLTLATQEAIERKLEMRVDALLLLLLSRFSRVWLCATPLTEAHQAPPSLGFSRQEHWSGLPFPSPMMKVKSEREVIQSCLTLSDPMDCSPPGSSVYGIFQAKVLEWGDSTILGLGIYTWEQWNSMFRQKLVHKYSQQQ